jgi:aspartate racemase
MGEFYHPEVSMHTHPLGDYMAYVESGNWDGVAKLMLSSSEKLAKIGAEFAICPDNMIHEVFSQVNENSPIPWLHIAEVVGHEAQSKGYSTLGITGTKYLMTSEIYPTALKKLNINYEIPDENDREKINKTIFEQLVNGVFTEESRLYFNEVIQNLKDRGCDAVVLGCTEIPILVDPSDCPLPTLDSTRLLARTAIKYALEDD